MRKQVPKTINQTFSIPIDVSQELHAYVKRREMSRFVSDAIRRELELVKHDLRKSYLEAREDQGQKEAENDWDTTSADGQENW